MCSQDIISQSKQDSNNLKRKEIFKISLGSTKLPLTSGEYSELMRHLKDEQKFQSELVRLVNKKQIGHTYHELNNEVEHL